MKKTIVYLRQLAATLSACAVVAGCSFDDSYDLRKDIDLTMQLGANGLTLPVGLTEKMYLRDLLKVDEHSTLDTLAGGVDKGLYYLQKGGTLEAEITVDGIDPFTPDPISVKTASIYRTATAVTGLNTSIEKQVAGVATAKFHIPDIPAEIQKIRAVVPVSGARLDLTLASTDPKFRLTASSGVRLTFPSYVRSSVLDAQNRFALPDNVSSAFIPVDSIVFSAAESVVSGDFLDVVGQIAVSGTFRLATVGAVDLAAGDSVCVVAQGSYPTIAIAELRGFADPDIDVTDEGIHIREDLPEFLRDERVVFDVANPTLKYVVRTHDLPAALLFSGEMISTKAGVPLASVEVPASGKISLPVGQTTVYFSQDAAPFDPAGVPAQAVRQQVPALGSLVRTLPDELNMNYGNRRISANPAVEQRLTLGQTYRAAADYTVFIPLVFNAATRIIHTDSIADLAADMKKFQGKGLTLTAKVHNTIPLGLQVSVLALDAGGSLIPGIVSASEFVQPGKTGIDTPVVSDLRLTLTAGHPTDVSRIDRLVFLLDGKAGALAAGEKLVSTQYIQLTDLRLRLDGAVVVNLNDDDEEESLPYESPSQQ